MADGEITLKLDAQTQARLEAAAQAAGRAVDEFAAHLIFDGLSDVTERLAQAHAALDDYQRTGIGYDATTEMTAFVARVASRSGKA